LFLTWQAKSRNINFQSYLHQSCTLRTFTFYSRYHVTLHTFIMKKWLAVILCLSCLGIFINASLLVSFPGAEGLGRFATGGRAGSNYVVSTLADSGAGSLRDALSAPNRIITFNVSGIITIKKRLVIPASTSVLGQTAPGGGITVYGNGISISGGSNSIIRYMRFRMGKGGNKGKDAITMANGWNVIVDHVSATWGRDETFSINAGEKAGNITIQDTIIAQGLETHSAGGLVQNMGTSIYRCLWADNKTRNPKVKGKNEFVNNVVYNWGGGGGYIAGGSESRTDASIVGNYFIAGPSTGKTHAFVRGNDNFYGSVRGNYVDNDRDGVLNGRELALTSEEYGGMKLVAGMSGFPGPANVLKAPDAVNHVLKNVGASKGRDAVDDQLIKEVQSWGKSGKLIHDENETIWASIYKGTRSVQERSALDSDGDGIPDEYELLRGWDIHNNDAMAIEESGYTRIEEWANSLVPAI
jgi:pectate lyase